MTARRLPVIWAALGAALPLLAAGCGGGVGTISGEVSFSGQPLGAGRVTFLSQVGEKKVLTAPIQGGKYEIRGCPAGPVKIIVESFAPPGKQEVPEFLKGFKPPNSGTGDSSLPYVPIPARYQNPEESGLDYTVKAGSQQHDLPLTP